MLLACVQQVDDLKNFCIVNTFDYISVSVGNEMICNDFNCPLLLLSSNVYFVRPSAVISAVSVVHECSMSCTFKEITSSRVVERETVQCYQTVFEHNWNNNICIVYCMPL